MSYSPTDAIERINTHAERNYEQWDEWVECLDTENKLEIIAGATTYEEALQKAAEWAKEALEIQGMRAENCALYDTGEQESTDRYNATQANAELSVADLMK
jgi:hypothetical protein